MQLLHFPCYSHASFLVVSLNFRKKSKTVCKNNNNNYIWMKIKKAHESNICISNPRTQEAMVIHDNFIQGNNRLPAREAAFSCVVDVT